MIAIEGDGSTVFRVFLPHAAKVELIGDFTDWSRGKLELTRQGRGWWELKAPIEPGEHTFCYLVDDTLHIADYAAHGVRMNQYGTWMSRLVVAEHAALETASTPAGNPVGN